MLILNRKLKEGVTVSGACRVVVLSIHKQSVRLGFEAAPDVTLHRDEVAERIQAALMQGRLDEAREEFDSEENKS